MAKMDPAQTADADKARSKYAYEVTKSIARSEGKTLLQCIQDGVVSKPQLMGWNDWQQWRRTTSPKQEVDGFRQDAEEEYRIYSETMQELYGPQWKTGLQTKEAGPVATGTEPLAGEVPTRNPGTSGVAVGSGHASGAREEAGSARSSPRRNGVDDADDVLQGNDPWLGKRLPGSTPPSPMQMSGGRGRSDDPSASSSSRPEAPPGLAERFSDFHVHKPVPDDSPSTPRGRGTMKEDEVKLQSPQPVRPPSAAETPEQSAKSEVSTLSTEEDPETLIQLCHAEYDSASGPLDQHLRRLMKNQERLSRMGRPLDYDTLTMLVARARYEEKMMSEEFTMEEDGYRGTMVPLDDVQATNRRKMWLTEEYMAQKEHVMAQSGETDEKSIEKERAKLRALSVLLVRYGVRVESLTREPTPPLPFDVSDMEFKVQRPASAASGLTWNSATGSRPQSRAQVGSGGSTPSFTPQQARQISESSGRALASGQGGVESVEDTVRRLLAAANAPQRSPLDDRLERLAGIVEASVESANSRRDNANAHRSILNLKPSWRFPEVFGKPTDDYEKFFKEFEETMAIIRPAVQTE